MNRSAKRQHHEQARKRHKHDQQQHARDVAKRPKPAFPIVFLAVGLGIMLLFVIGVTALR